MFANYDEDEKYRKTDAHSKIPVPRLMTPLEFRSTSSRSYRQQHHNEQQHHSHPHHHQNQNHPSEQPLIPQQQDYERHQNQNHHQPNQHRDNPRNYRLPNRHTSRPGPYDRPSESSKIPQPSSAQSKPIETDKTIIPTYKPLAPHIYSFEWLESQSSDPIPHGALKINIDKVHDLSYFSNIFINACIPF